MSSRSNPTPPASGPAASAPCNGGTSICNSEGAVIYKLEISSPGIEYGKRITHGAAVAVNNDWDCTNTYAAGAPGGHRELEPIFDFDNVAATGAEDDLLQVIVKLTPVGPGTVKLTATAGAANIKIWPAKTKGAAADQITLPIDVPTGMLPKEVFIEGLSTGSTTIEAKYTSPDGVSCSDSITINVVDLVEKQGGTRKIIYDYNTIIDFEVIAGPANYDYEWDLDGDGSYNSKPFEVSNNNKSTAQCKYGAAESANTVLLSETPANKRKIYGVSVKLTGGLILKAKGTTRFGGVVTTGIRVALGTFQGDPLPAQSTAGLHTLFNWNDNNPVKFDATDAAHTGTKRISYKAAMAGANAETPYGPGLGAARTVTFVEVGPGIWASGQKKEDLIATVNHEIKHLRQHVAVRDNVPASNVWRLLDTHYGSPAGYRDFRECDGHNSEVMDDQIGWLHLLPAGQGDLDQFSTRYNNCLGLLAIIPAGAARTAALQLLQGYYRDLPFDEMKRPGYDFYLRAPL